VKYRAGEGAQRMFTCLDLSPFCSMIPFFKALKTRHLLSHLSRRSLSRSIGIVTSTFIRKAVASASCSLCATTDLNNVNNNVNDPILDFILLKFSSAP
jgi:hypothetical protein